MSDFDQLADEIVANSAGPVFGVPGSGATLSLLDALEKRGRDFVLTHFEGAAAMMAGTVGRLDGRPGVALSIKGPGVTNMLPGLAVSHFESFPMIAVVEAYGQGTPEAKAHKRIDQSILTQTVAKGITQFVPGGPGFPGAARLASAETPGPVVFELASPQPDKASPLPDAEGFPSEDEAVLSLVGKARKPIVIAGMLAIRQGCSSALNALNVPVFSTAAAKGVVDETASHAAGVYTGVGLEMVPEHDLIAGADLIVCIGMRPNEVLATRPFGVPAVNIAGVAEPGSDAFAFEAQAGPQVLAEVLESLSAKSWGKDQVVAAQDRMLQALRTNRFMPAQAFERAQSHFNGRACAVFDTGYFCTIAEHVWQAVDASQCLMSGQGRYMGTGIPMAIGAAIHRATEPTVAFLGDGGIGPFVGEVKIAVERRLPLLFCLLTDGRFASIRTRSLKDGLTEQPLTPALPSWMGVMVGFGMPVTAASDEQSFADALAAWRPEDGPAYIEVSFEPNAYEAMVKGIR